jgi:hypothetical protein
MRTMRELAKEARLRFGGEAHLLKTREELLAALESTAQNARPPPDGAPPQDVRPEGAPAVEPPVTSKFFMDEGD